MSWVIFYHKNCLDGFSSAALLKRFLNYLGFKAIKFREVGYPLSTKWWKNLKLKTNFAVVDFRYHPKATIWFDHHLTTFISQKWKNLFKTKKNNKLWVFDPHSPSCTGLILKTLKNFNFRITKEWENFVKMVDRYDSAEYSPHDILKPKNLAAKLFIALAENKLITKFKNFLLENMFTADLKVIEKNHYLKLMYKRGLKRLNLILKSAKKEIIKESENLIAWPVKYLSNLSAQHWVSFYLYPKARYAVIYLKKGKIYEFRVYFNKLKFKNEVPPVHLGSLVAKFLKGGGGHQGVGAGQAKSLKQIKQIINKLKVILK